MRVGELARLTLAPEYAYGEESRQGIPAHSTLIFEVELLSFEILPVTPQEKLAWGIQKKVCRTHFPPRVAYTPNCPGRGQRDGGRGQRRRSTGAVQGGPRHGGIPL